MKAVAAVRRWFVKPAHRRYVYRVVNAGVGAGVVYGVASGEAAAAALLVVNAVLGLADTYVPADE